jgi:septum formation protein
MLSSRDFFEGIARMLYLASQSPRRRELLELIGQRYEIVHVDVPELRGAEETPQAYVSRVARDKARAGLAALPDASDAVVLGADTEVVLDGEVFGKPADATDAAAMLRRLSGRVHRVLSAVWCVAADREEHRFSQTEVSFAALTTAQIDAYLDTGEWRGKAGAYAIQGRAAAFVPQLSGSYSGVMGLPLFETAELLRAFGE